MPFANTNKEVRNFTLLYKATPANVVQLFTKNNSNKLAFDLK